MFLAGTLGIIIGGPFAYIVGSFYPEVALSNGEVVEIINCGKLVVVQIKPPC
jgi:hypothetical protein